MIRSGRRTRLMLHAMFAAVAVLLLAGCSDGMHGAANASGSDHGSAGQIRLGLPF